MSSTDLISLFVAPLNRLGLTYMATGAVAAIVYGEPRLTNDIDLVVSIAPSDAPRFEASFPSPQFYIPPAEVIREEASRPRDGHFNVIHSETSLKADVYLMGDDPLHAWAMEHRRRVGVGGEQMWIAPPEYVILRKLTYYRESGQEKHLRDIAKMLLASDALINRLTIEAWATRLGVSEQWEAVLNDESGT